jgi:hypothetical protein
MMMSSGKDDVENRLHQFRPRRPAAIPDERLQLLRGPIWVAVAASTAAVMLIVTLVRKPQSAPVPAVSASPDATLGELTALALEDPDRFDAVLTRMSPDLLLDVRRPGGVLLPLAKE